MFNLDRSTDDEVLDLFVFQERVGHKVNEHEVWW